MEMRTFGRTGWRVSEVGLGTWAFGGAWGTVSESDSIAVMEAAIARGVNFFDTADVYGNGKSEKLIAQVLKKSKTRVYVATKFGRRLSPHTADQYTLANLENHLDRSLANLGLETVDLVQLHCPPSQVYYMPELFEGLDKLAAKGKLRHYGVSVEKSEEALKAIEYPGVVSVQIIFNIFRQRPAELFFQECRKRNVAVLARVPLASGLLAGKMKPDSSFPKDDHRNFNRNGEMFDVGETFSGVPFDLGLRAVEELKALKPAGLSCVQLALAWILSHPEVSCVIPGAKNLQQLEDNVSAGAPTRLDAQTLAKVNAVYEKLVKPAVHHRW